MNIKNILCYILHGYTCEEYQELRERKLYIYLSECPVFKIERKFWNLIEADRKSIEIRKINKDFVKVGQYILFVDCKTNEKLGYCEIQRKSYLTPADLICCLKNADEEREFVINNYLDEKLLIIFKISRAIKFKKYNLGEKNERLRTKNN